MPVSLELTDALQTVWCVAAAHRGGGGGGGRPVQQPDCHEAGAPVCEVGLAGGQKASLAVVNSLAWDRDDVVTFLVPAHLPGHPQVTDQGGKAVTSQSSWTTLPGGGNATSVSFRAVGVPALGAASYTLAFAAAGGDGDGGDAVPQHATSQHARAAGPPVLENGCIKLEFSATGELAAITNKVSGVATAASLGVRYYTPTDTSRTPEPHDAVDGTYDFHSVDSVPYAFPGPTSFRVARGDLYDEVVLTVDAASGIELVTRLYAIVSRSISPPWGSIRFRLALRTYAPWGVRVVSQTKSRKIPTRNTFPLFFGIRYKDGDGGGEAQAAAGTNYIEVFVKVGAVQVSDGVSKDVILQVNTTIATGGESYVTPSRRRAVMFLAWVFFLISSGSPHVLRAHNVVGVWRIARAGSQTKSNVDCRSRVMTQTAGCKVHGWVRDGAAEAHAGARVRVASRSISPPWGSIRFRLALRTYAPWGVRVVSQTKSRKIPTRNILPLFFASRTFNNTITTEPGNNYYPVTVLSSIKTKGTRGAQMQLAWLSDRAEGCGSMHNGSLEKMVYRRLLQGDGKGMSVPLNGTDKMVSRHVLVFDTPPRATSQMRNLYWRGYHPLATAAMASPAGAGLVSPGALGTPPMATPLPSNLLLQTLQVLANDWDSIPAPYDVPSPHAGGNTPVPHADPSALKDGTVLLRLHHIYAKGEGLPGDSDPASVDLGKLFAAKSVTKALALTLSAIQPLANLSRLEWKTVGARPAGSPVPSGGLVEVANDCAIDTSDGGMVVTIGPMDICTYQVTFA